MAICRPSGDGDPLQRCGSLRFQKTWVSPFRSTCKSTSPSSEELVRSNAFPSSVHPRFLILCKPLTGTTRVDWLALERISMGAMRARTEDEGRTVWGNVKERPTVLLPTGIEVKPD